MTLDQLITVGLAGPLGFIMLLRLYPFFKGVKSYSLWEAVVLVVCILAIVVAFLGVK